MNALAELRSRFIQVLSELTPDPATFAAMVKPTQDANFGDFQANCAMPLGKRLGKPPREVAQEIVARLATKHHAALVKFQHVFDDACKRAPEKHWIWDGVHPTYSGHQLMADEWVRTVKEFWPAGK